jgi:ring-1,2-phenylacetyl-CoA epoxidase subunit PaaE
VSVDFHPLRVLEVSPLTDDAVAVTFDVPDDLVGEFRFVPGQHVTLRVLIDGEDVRRSYSICSNANGESCGWASNGSRAGLSATLQSVT